MQIEKIKAETAALFATDDTHEATYKASDWYKATEVLPSSVIARYFSAVTNNWFQRALGFESSAEALILSDFSVVEEFQHLNEARAHTRVRAAGEGFRVYCPVSYWSPLSTGPLSLSALAQYWLLADGVGLRGNMRRNLRDLLDPAAAIDLPLPRSVLEVPGLTAAMLALDDEQEFTDLKNCVRGLRVISPACQAKFDREVRPELMDGWTAGTLTAQETKSVLNALMRSRTMVVFAEFEVNAETAQFICQGEPKLSVLGQYFQHMMEFIWSDGAANVYVHNMMPVSRIAETNARATYTPTQRTDANGLTVNSRGNLMWMPTADAAEFVESEIEVGGTQPNGEWTALDCLDPENTEFIMAPSVDGRMVRQRKPKGRNRLLYTDWYNSRLSYTKDDGNMSVMDLSMFRPAGAHQLAQILSVNLNEPSGSSVRSSISFALNRGRDMGVQVAMNPEWFDPEFFADSVAEQCMTALHRDNALNSFVTLVFDVYSKIRTHAELHTGATATPEQIAVADDILENLWLQVDYVSANSPIKPMRALWTYLDAVFQRAMENPEQLFGKYAVTTTLNEMGVLSVIARYAGQHAELDAKDRAERDVYLTPNLQPINQIEVTNVPFVSGNVELFPHQVKAWNWIKNMPPNMVIDVAAGGGKTMLALLDIANQLGEATVKKPLVICPADLVRNYINDGNFLFAGRMNMVVINNTTFNSKEWGEEKLVQLAQHAPVNTIFLTDFDFVTPKGSSKRIVNAMYGSVRIRTSLNTEFLQRIPFDGVWIDESHKTKNPGSLLNRELMRLIGHMPFKRELSGTYVHDNLIDVVGQFGLLDPNVFGDKDQFEEEYYPDGMRAAPRPGAQVEIYNKMAEYSNVITIRRKEWAALLPRREDTFYGVMLTPAQQKVYEEILEVQQEAFEQQLGADEDLRAFFNAGNRRPDDGEEDAGPADREDDAEMEAKIEGKLGFYLARLERFLTAPGSDPLSSQLHGSDLVSPKLAKVIDICKQHLREVAAGRIHGKILIWTQYIESAAAIYRALPPELKDLAVHYSAGSADAAMSEFKTNKKKMIMVGCEKSMNTGHNLQFCSRIIRLETVWNWGTLEQGESRINRPQRNDPRKHADGSPGIFYDWVFCDRSVDVTKNARMISKLISTVKFYERKNPAYQSLPELEPITLSKKNIFSINDANDPENGCMQYFQIYGQYQNLEQKEFDDFERDPKNQIEPWTLEEGRILDGSGLLRRVPYIPQMEIYNAEQLGLVPFMQYIGTEYNGDKKHPKLLSDDEAWSPEGMKIHTEYGDCVSKGYNRSKNGRPSTMRVVTPDGSTVTVPLTMCWAITKDVTSGRDIRAALALRVGAEPELVVPQQEVLTPTTPRVAPDEDDDTTAQGFEVYADTYNNMVALMVLEDENTVAVRPELKKLGFTAIPEYYYTRVKTAKALRNWIDTVQKKCTIDPRYLAELEKEYALFAKHQTLEKFSTALNQGQRRNFLLQHLKAIPKGNIKPYLVVHNQGDGDEVFLCLDKKVNAASWNMVRNVAVTGIKWKQNAVGAGEYWNFCTSIADAKTKLKAMFTQFNITNRKDVVETLSRVRIIKQTQTQPQR